MYNDLHLTRCGEQLNMVRNRSLTCNCNSLIITILTISIATAKLLPTIIGIFNILNTCSTCSPRLLWSPDDAIGNRRIDHARVSNMCEDEERTMAHGGRWTSGKKKRSEEEAVWLLRRQPRRDVYFREDHRKMSDDSSACRIVYGTSYSAVVARTTNITYIPWTRCVGKKLIHWRSPERRDVSITTGMSQHASHPSHRIATNFRKSIARVSHWSFDRRRFDRSASGQRREQCWDCRGADQDEALKPMAFRLDLQFRYTIEI